MSNTLSVEDVVQQYPGVLALKGVSLDIDAGRVLALVGENGAGKSTLIRILAGIEQPSAGVVRLRGDEQRFASSAESQRAGISVVSQEFRLVPQLSIADNVMLGHEETSMGVVRRGTTRARVRGLMDLLGLELDPDRLVGSLTTGDQQMVEIARALSREFDVLIMDEPTAALNRTEIVRLHGIVRRLAEQGKAIVYVSHHLDEVFDLCDDVAVLRDGELVHRSRTDELDEAALVEQMLGRTPQTLDKRHAVTAVTESGMAAEGIQLGGYSEPFSLAVSAGEILGLAGLIGSGRSELTRALFGDLPMSSGVIHVDGRAVTIRSVTDAVEAGIFMLSDDRKNEGILPHLDVTENAMVSRNPRATSLWNRIVPSRNREAAAFEGLRRDLRIRVPHGRQLIGNLSGGNQQKVLLARALESGCKVLLLNEPTRGVDVGAKLEIYQLIRGLAAAGTAVIVSSSDAPELATVADRCLVYLAGRLTAELVGSDISEENIVSASVGQAPAGRSMAEQIEVDLDPDAVAETERDRSEIRAERAARRRGLLQKLGVSVPFVLVLIAGVVWVPNFLSASNVTNMLVNGAVLAITAYGMTMVIALRGIDLSVGSTQAVVACIAAASVNAWGLLPGVVAGIAAAVALGLVNGIVVTAFRVPAFIATLATMGIFRGVALIFTGGAPIMIADAHFRSISTSSLLGVPVPFLLAVLLGSGFWFALNRMRFGKHLVAVGGSPESARDSGISAHRIHLTAYVVAAVSAGVAGILLASQLGNVNGSLSSGLELQAIAVVVLGGTSMAGGRGNVAGTFIAALLLAMINSSLNLLNVASFYQYVALGALLIFALSLDSVQRAAVRRVLEGRGVMSVAPPVRRAEPTPSGGSRALNASLAFLSRQYLLAIVIVAFVVVGIFRPSFWGHGNIENVLFETALVGIAACGMVLLITGGLLDLSVAGILAVSAIAVGTVLPYTTIGGAIALALAVGAVLGLLNGVLVTYVKIAPFIATLGTLYLFLGLSFIWTNGSVVAVTSQNFRRLTTGAIGVVPYAFIILVLVGLLTYLVLYRTTFGRTIRAMGSNERAARLAGMHVNRTKVLVFVVAGACFALAGVFMAGRLSSAEGNMAVGMEMSVIAAVVVGGTALRGGRGTVFGAIVGALLFSMLAKALNMLSVPSYWQYIVTGAVLIVAVAIGARRRSAAEVRGAG